MEPVTRSVRQSSGVKRLGKPVPRYHLSKFSNDMKRLAGTLLIAGGTLLAQSSGGQPVEITKEWPTYGHYPGAMRFSPLTQITPANVGKIKVAWTYHMKPAGAAAPVAAPQRPAAPG